MDGLAVQRGKGCAGVHSAQLQRAIGAVEGCGGDALNLIDDWPKVLRHALSIKFSLLAGVCGALEVALPMFSDNVPRGWFSLLTVCLALASVVFRQMAQPEMNDDQP